jgi:hypothetical protein
MLFLSGGVDILVSGLKLAGSPLSVADLDQVALGYLNMSMLKPLWEEVWIGILGIYTALGLKQGKTHAWGLGLGWGIMLITNGAVQGIYEVIGLGWPYACMQTYLYLSLGVIALVVMIFSRKYPISEE